MKRVLDFTPVPLAKRSAQELPCHYGRLLDDCWNYVAATYLPRQHDRMSLKLTCKASVRRDAAFHLCLPHAMRLIEPHSKRAKQAWIEQDLWRITAGPDGSVNLPLIPATVRDNGELWFHLGTAWSIALCGPPPLPVPSSEREQLNRLVLAFRPGIDDFWLLFLTESNDGARWRFILTPDDIEGIRQMMGHVANMENLDVVGAVIFMCNRSYKRLFDGWCPLEPKFAAILDTYFSDLAKYDAIRDGIRTDNESLDNGEREVRIKRMVAGDDVDGPIDVLVRRGEQELYVPVDYYRANSRRQKEALKQSKRWLAQRRAVISARYIDVMARARIEWKRLDNLAHRHHLYRYLAGIGQAHHLYTLAFDKGIHTIADFETACATATQGGTRFLDSLR